MIHPLNLNTGRKIGPGFPTYIIAEAGSNHDGSLDKALMLISLAKKAGADAVKFQSFHPETLTNVKTKVQNNWVKEKAFDLLLKLALPLEWHEKLLKKAKEEKIDFLSTPFDLERLELLNRLDIPLIKIASGDLTNPELLVAAAKTKKPIVISTGAALLGEIEKAYYLLKEEGATEIAILQCVSSYPARFEEVNLQVLKTIQRAFEVPVGYSDHTPGIVVPLGAVAFHASIIEKHFTDDKNLKGPDHATSLNPVEFKLMIDSIRDLEKAIGHGIKEPSAGEIEERVMARRALYAKSAIAQGETLSRDNIKVVRHFFPGSISAWDLNLALGRQVLRPIEKDEIISWNDFK